MTARRGASDAVVNRVVGYLTALLTRGVTAYPSARQLAIDVAQSLDLALRTIQRAFTDDRAAVLVSQLVCPTVTPGRAAGANTQVDGSPPAGPGADDTSLLLGPLGLSSPGADQGAHDRDPERSPAFYTKLRPNDHPGYCIEPTCRRWVDPGEGVILVPYPTNARVPLVCAEHAVILAAERELSKVRT